MPKPGAESFTLLEAWEYDHYAHQDPRYYEIAGKALLDAIRDAGGIKNGDRVIEVGAGTGNFTIPLILTYPELQILFAVEPNQFISLAQYKLTPRELLPVVSGMTPDAETVDFINRQKSRSSAVAGRVKLIQGQAEAIPVPNDFVDAVVACQVIQWLDLHSSLEEFSRVLKRGGLLGFDTSANQFDFEDRVIDGRKAKPSHYRNHPFNHAYLTELGRELESLGYGKQTFNPEKLYSNHNMFTERSLTGALERSGFRIIPLCQKTPPLAVGMNGEEDPAKPHVAPRSLGEVGRSGVWLRRDETLGEKIPRQKRSGGRGGFISPSSGDLFKVTAIRIGKQDLPRVIGSCSFMDVFSSPGLGTLSDDQRQDIARRVMGRTIEKYASILDRVDGDLPCYEYICTFVARSTERTNEF